MLKMTIDGEEVVSKNNFTIKEEMLSPSSTILNNTYPKTWEDDKDYTSRFYYPKDYAKLDIQNFSITPEEAGTTIEINGSATLTDVDTTKESRVLRLLGQTSQNGTPTPDTPIPVNVVSGDNEINICGKNLFNKDNSQIGKAWNNASASNRAIVITKVEPKTTYNISYQDKSGVDGIYFFGRTNKDDSTTSMGTTEITSSPRQVITLANTYYLGIQFNKTNVSQTDIDNVGIQIEKGSTATTYEPYIGNTYPIYLGVLGKNLFTSKVEQGAINANAGSTYTNVKTSNTTRIRTTDLIRLDKTKSYTISCKTGYNVVLQAFNDNQLLYIVDGTTNTWVSSKTFTNIPYIAVAVRKTDNSNITPSEINNAEVMLEVGTSASTYEAPNPLELCKIGTYQDYIYKDNGKWYLYKEIGKVVLDGSETWNKNNNAFQSLESTTPNKGAVYLDAYSNYYTHKYYASSITTNIQNGEFGWNSGKIITIRNDSCSTANDFKTWLGTHNTIVYYVLATPTTTEITETTLIEQLDNLQSD